MKALIAALCIAASTCALASAKVERDKAFLDEVKRAAAVAQATAIEGGRIVVAQVSMNCGIAPIPPIGCRVGPCVCDATGTNCQWTFVCK